MRSLHRRRAIRVLLVAGVAACTFPPAGDQGGPIAVRVLELELSESDSVYLSRPTSVLRDDRATFVADMFQNRIVEYNSATGRAQRTLGRSGGGPGEFRDVASLFLIGDTVVGAMDYARRTFTLFDRGTGAFLRRRRHEGLVNGVVTLPRMVVFADMNLERRTAVGVWDLASDTIEYRIPLAREYVESADLAGMYSAGSVVVWKDTVFLAMTGLNRVEYYTVHGTRVGGIELPVRRRRGSSPEILERMKPAPGRTYEERWGRASAVRGLHRSASGRLIIVHSDQELRTQGRLITGVSFISVLSTDRSMACVDGHLDVTQDAQPAFTFVGDTVFVLEQRMRGDRVRTTVSGYLMDTSKCDWLEVQPYVPTD